MKQQSELEKIIKEITSFAYLRELRYGITSRKDLSYKDKKYIIDLCNERSKELYMKNTR